MGSEKQKKAFLDKSAIFIEWIVDFIDDYSKGRFKSSRQHDDMDGRVEAIFLLPYFSSDIKVLTLLKRARVESVLIN